MNIRACTRENTERQICREGEPMPKGDKGYWIHPYAIDDGECSEGCCDYYKCPVCGLNFKCEVAQ